MQTPIISPWLIYLIDATFGIRMILSFVVAAFILLAVWFFLKQDENRFRTDIYGNSYGNKNKEKSYRRKKIVCIVVSTISLVVLFLIPSRETCYQMLVAHYVTYENAEIAGDQAKELVDCVLDRVDEIANGGAEND